MVVRGSRLEGERVSLVSAISRDETESKSGNEVEDEILY